MHVATYRTPKRKIALFHIIYNYPRKEEKQSNLVFYIGLPSCLVFLLATLIFIIIYRAKYFNSNNYLNKIPLVKNDLFNESNTNLK